MNHKCGNCRWCVELNEETWCLLARNKCADAKFIETDCDFWRLEHDNIHDNDAMDRQIEKNDQSLPNQE